MDPRIERTRAAVMEAATDLVLEAGPSALTMDAVVARSGVAKSTLYRHWATRDELVGAVFAHLAPDFEPVDPTLGFEDALRVVVGVMVDLMADEHWQRVVPALLLLRAHHPDLAALQDELKQEQDDVIQEVLSRGMREGILPADLDLELAITLTVGPILMAGLIGTVPLDDRFTTTLTERLLRSLP